MDRWGHYTKLADEERDRARLVPAWIDVCVLAGIVVSLTGSRLLLCAIEQGPLGSCMQAGIPRVLGISLHSAGLLLGIWAGPRSGLRLQSTELGWLSGALMVVAVSAALVWIGLPIGV